MTELIKDILFSIILLITLAALLYAYAGVWPPMVSVEGKSMLPNMKQGDLILIQGLSHKDVTTRNNATGDGYKMFNQYGDVIVFSPMGDGARTPVIHRAMYWVNQGQEMWPNGPPAPHSGYITQGDNNFLYDQSSPVSPNQPVKPEWVLGVAKHRIPYLGMIRSKIG